MQYRSALLGHSASSRNRACAFRRSRPRVELAEEMVKQLKRKTTRALKLQPAAGKEVFHPQQQDEETETTVLYQETVAENGEICESHARRERSHFEGASVVMNM